MLKALLEGAMLATDPHDIIEGSCWSKPIPAEAVLKNYRSSQGALEGFGEQNAYGAAEQSARLQLQETGFESAESSRSKSGRHGLSAPNRGLSCQKEASAHRQNLSDEQKTLLQLMGDGYHSAESLSEVMGRNIREIHQTLTALEISNLVTRHRSGYCKR